MYENLVDRGGNELTMVMGLAYCCAVYPLDQLVFARMLRGSARAAENSYQSVS